MEVWCPFWRKDEPETNPWEYDIFDPEKPWARSQIINYLDACVRGTKDGRPADVIVMQMAHFDASLQVFAGLKRYGKPLVAEIDDNYISTPEYNPAFSGYAPGQEFRRIANSQFEYADAMIVSTPYLREVYSHLNDHIYVVPNSIDFRAWNVKPRSRPGIRIGWAGGYNHHKDLKIIEPVIKNILAKHRDVKFSLVHGAPLHLREIPGVEFVSKFAPIHQYPRHIAAQDWDIALAPLVDNAFNRGKSNLRWLESGALGIPCVASKVGYFAETIEHGIDGFLADHVGDTKKHAEEFEKYLDILITDRKLRTAMGLRAKDRINRDFNVDKVVYTYVEHLKDIIARGQVEKDEDRIIYGRKSLEVLQ